MPGASPIQACSWPRPRRWGWSFPRSAIVGDRAQDLQAGRTAGLAIGLHVSTGHGASAEQVASRALARPGFEVMLSDQIGGAKALLRRLGA